MNTCITSFGKGHNFIKGIERLKINIEKDVKLPFFGYTEYPTDCPTHEKSPFAFKFYCINECLKMGYKQILWLDSSVIVKNSLEDVFNFINQYGYFFVMNGHNIGAYCHDKALKTLGITREQSFQIPSLQGTNFGLNFENDSAIIFLKKMFEYANDNITFVGPHNNNNNYASTDNRVLGHRHEQTAMSVVSIKLGMNKWAVNETKWFYHDRNYVKSVISTVEDINMSEER